MKNILILCEGSIAKSFLEWINKTRVAKNKYHVATNKIETIPEKIKNIITISHIDPTSYSKLLKLFAETKFSKVFIVMEDSEETLHTLNNVRKIDLKLPIVLLDRWGMEHNDIENITVLNEQKIIAAHLYDHLPNVPVIAQNIGLAEGEIMEILVPFGSNYAYRHIGSITQKQWKIVAIYRKKKQIIPTDTTMIYPNDTLLVIGKPMVLDSVYRSVNRRIGQFPEPFGRNIYLILDFNRDEKMAIIYLQESIYLAQRLKNKKLFVRIINPSNFNLLESLKLEERANVFVHICYHSKDINNLIEFDIQTFDIGLILNSLETFDKLNLVQRVFQLKKIIYIFGEKSLYDIKESIILMTENYAQMESISSVAIDFSESMGVALKLCDFNPEGEFESKKIIIEHYEALSQIFNSKVEIIQDKSNPIRKLKNMNDIIEIAAYNDMTKRNSLVGLISTKVQDFLLLNNKHPKILVPSEFYDV